MSMPKYRSKYRNARCTMPADVFRTTYTCHEHGRVSNPVENQRAKLRQTHEMAYGKPLDHEMQRQSKA